MSDIARLQRTLGYEFDDVELLRLALTHRSAGGRNNERLEFLGDSILNHVIAEALYAQFPEAREGQLSRMRAAMVKGETLADIASQHELGQHLQLGSGERKSGGHRRRSILADTLEAIFGAILLDSDVDSCRARILALYATRLASLDLNSVDKDAKTRLQEFLQGRNRPLPEYTLVATRGEDHAREFEVSCAVSGSKKREALAFIAVGSSRRKAEQGAAKAALKALCGDD